MEKVFPSKPEENMKWTDIKTLRNVLGQSYLFDILLVFTLRASAKLIIVKTADNL